MSNKSKNLIVRDLGRQEFHHVWQAMQEFTSSRDESTTDELWCLEHPAVFTMGLNGKDEHLLNVENIPVINIDRGGQVTFHGPGQLVIYTLIDLARLNIGVKYLVTSIEKSIIALLQQYGIKACGQKGAPGVYVEEKKIAALGLRIKRNKSYHGLALNIDMDLSPFQQINPCGYAGMEVTQIKELKNDINIDKVKLDLITLLSEQLGYKKENLHFTSDSVL